MTVLIEMVRNIVVIILLTTFLEMILPSSSMQRFVKAVLGLFVLVAVLNPILKIIKNNQDFEVFTWYQESIPQFDSVQEQGERLTKVNEDMFMQNYQQRIEGQMKSLVILTKGINNVEVQVKLERDGKEVRGSLIEEVMVTVEREGKEQEQEREQERKMEKDEDKERSQEQEEKKSAELVKPVKIVAGKPKEKEKSGGKTAGGSIEKVFNRDDQLIEHEIMNTLCQYFGLNEKQIVVIFR